MTRPSLTNNAFFLENQLDCLQHIFDFERRLSQFRIHNKIPVGVVQNLFGVVLGVIAVATVHSRGNQNRMAAAAPGVIHVDILRFGVECDIVFR